MTVAVFNKKYFVFSYDVNIIVEVHFIGLRRRAELILKGQEKSVKKIK